MADTMPASRDAASDQPTEESLLVDWLTAISDKRNGYFGVHLHLSRLKTVHKKPHFMRIARRSLEGLINNSDTTVFTLANYDLVLICRAVPVDEVDNTVYKIRGLFSEDPLTSAKDGTIEDRFATWYDLCDNDDFAALLQISEGLYQANETERKRRRDTRTDLGQMTGDTIGPKNLVDICKALDKVRLSDLIQTQLALKVKRGLSADLLFREQFISMRALQARLAPNVNLVGSPWLFQYMSEILDKRMLQIVLRDDVSNLDEPLSLNLNISSINTREFQEFNQVIAGTAQQVFIEFQLIDVFSDLGAYYDTRDLLQDRGYRLVLDGITPIGLGYFSPESLGFDLVKVVWSKEFKSEISKDRHQKLKDQLSAIGFDKVILSRVDTEDAVGWGLSLGVSRFQGHFIDGLISAMIAKGLI